MTHCLSNFPLCQWPIQDLLFTSWHRDREPLRLRKKVVHYPSARWRKISLKMPQEFHLDLSCYNPTQYATVTPKLFTFGSFFFLQDNVLLISKDVFSKKKKKKSKDVISKSYKTTKVKINTIKPIKKRVKEILKRIVNLKVKRAKLLYSKYNPTVSALLCN